MDVPEIKEPGFMEKKKVYCESIGLYCDKNCERFWCSNSKEYREEVITDDTRSENVRVLGNDNLNGGGDRRDLGNH